MPNYTDEDFPEVTDAATLGEVMSTGFGPAGTPGTPEHAEAVADALGYADSDIYYDYADNADFGGYATAAATHANVCSLQSATSYAARMLQALARDPELLAQVQAAMDADPTPSPR